MTAKRDLGTVIVAENKFTYDNYRNLIGEAQQHGAAVDTNSPTVSYDWDLSGSGTYNFNRVVGITYPERAGTSTASEITFDYGNNTDDIDSRLNRITNITHSDTNFGELSAYAYMGMGRRVSTSFGNGIEQTFAGGSGYTGLDGFGRVIDLDFTLSSSTVHRYQYGYNDAGDRTYARVTHADSGGSHDNDRSYLYSYDALHRLVASELGELNGTNTAIVTGGGAPELIRRVWALDNLGNWSADAPSSMQVTSDDGGGEQFVVGFHHSVDSANQLAELIEYDGFNTVDTQYRYDPNGNLVDDGNFTYHYDAWNRLVQINADTGYEGYGSLNQPDSGGDFGEPIMRFVYDGLGRLIAKEWDVGNYGFGDPDTTVDYYYDGVRRIQENHSTGLLPGAPSADTDTLREYVWAPGYVDAALAQIDVDPVADEILYFIHDANYNVVAATDDAGDVVAQYVYTPYGELELVDDLTAHQPIAIGHQGLFFEPLDAATPDPTLTEDTPSIYHNRNRTYSPSLGRFLQRDPNETGQILLTALAANAQSLSAIVGSFDLQALYADGLNLHTAYGNNPVSRRDPSGLDFQDMIDEAIADVQADKAAALTSIRSSVGHVISVGKFLAEQAFGFLPGADAMLLIKKLANGEDITLSDIALGAASVGGAAILFKIVGKTVGILRKVKNARRIGRHSDDPLVSRALAGC